MPGVPYREDDDPRVAPARALPREPRPVRSADEGDDPRPGLVTHVQRHPVPRGPALEGLTATGAAVVALVGTTLGAVIDAAASPGLGWMFFIAFVAMSAFVGLRLRGRDSWASAAVPPLVFIAAAGLAAQVAPASEGSWVQRTSGDMAAAVLDHPFMLLVGTALAVLAVGYRTYLD